MRKSKRVLIIGAGIAGVATAEKLSSAGCQVYLIDKQSAIGGHAAEMGCKATDVCLRCNVCVANELFRNVAACDNIHIHTKTQLKALENGGNGSCYTAVLEHKPVYIDRKKCIGCQLCVKKYPEFCKLPEVSVLSFVPVIVFSSGSNNPGKKLEKVCPVGAIDTSQENSQSLLDVDAVVVATGYEPFDASLNPAYGYKAAENIISGIEAEKQLAVQNRITRPSDGRTPKRIAFVQCVGSRSGEVQSRPENTNYCSAVCCSYALRMARLAKYQDGEAEITIFYMDIQNFGKNFDEFYGKCKDRIDFIRSRPYEVKQNHDGSVLVKFTPEYLPSDVESQVCERQFDLVVLSVGICPRQDVQELAEKLKIPVDEYGFLGFKNASALPELQRRQIYAAGACESPRDIKSCIAQAQAVSAAIVSEA